MTPEELKAAALSWLGIPEGSDGPDVEAAGLVAPAVHAFVDALPGIRRTTEPDGASTWGKDTALGATMLAARLVRRRNSPQGVAAFTEQGGAAYVSREDPDVARLLRVGPFAAPRVG